MKPVRFLLSVILPVFFLPALYAAVVTLKSGGEIQGPILKKTDDYIEISLQGIPKQFKLSEVTQISGRKPHLTPAPQAAGLTQTLPVPEAAQQKKETAPAEPVKDSWAGTETLTFENALKSAAEGKFEEAKAVLKKILPLYPDDKNIPQSINILADLDKTKISREYTRYLFKGYYSLFQKQYREAIQNFKKTLDLKPGNLEVYHSLGKAYQALEEYNQAIFYFAKLKETYPQDLDTTLNLAISYFKLKEYEKAIPYLEKIVENNPADAETFVLLGISQYAVCKYELSKYSLNKAQALFLEQKNPEKAQETARLIDSLP